ncbi:MAG: glycine cleavage system aminomethyltransferase GcvT [Pseudomonadota bacterium]
METVETMRRTPLFALHGELGAKMVPFAGYEMPLQYAPGIMAEHLHCRAAAGLFDVSHMGQIILRGRDYAALARAFEMLAPVDMVDLGENRQRYAFLTNAQGGIEDDLMCANRGDHLLVVVNAARKEHDLDLMRARLEPECRIEAVSDRALLALQGPKAEAVLTALNSAVMDMRFMDVATLDLMGTACWVSRSGYTGEDGFEISIPAEMAEQVARRLLAHPDVAPIGLGARDTLRLEAGLCLYGHDIDETTTPVEAALSWAIQKVRRTGGARARGFPGADQILSQLRDGAARKRVGLRADGRAPMRAGTRLFADAAGEHPVGIVTSGGFGPTVAHPVAMGYAAADHAGAGTPLYGLVRGKMLSARVSDLPFTPSNFKR